MGTLLCNILDPSLCMFSVTFSPVGWFIGPMPHFSYLWPTCLYKRGPPPQPQTQAVAVWGQRTGGREAQWGMGEGNYNRISKEIEKERHNA